MATVLSDLYAGITTSVYELSFEFENGDVAVIPRQKQRYGAQLYEDSPSLDFVCLSLTEYLAEDEADQYSDSFSKVLAGGDPEAVMDYLLGTGKIEELFRGERPDTPLIEVVGAFAEQAPFTYDFKVVVNEFDAVSPELVLHDLADEDMDESLDEDDWQKAHPKRVEVRWL